MVSTTTSTARPATKTFDIRELMRSTEGLDDAPPPAQSPVTP